MSFFSPSPKEGLVGVGLDGDSSALLRRLRPGMLLCSSGGSASRFGMAHGSESEKEMDFFRVFFEESFRRMDRWDDGAMCGAGASTLPGLVCLRC